MTASSRDYRTYVCNLPNHKNEDRFSETFLSIKGPVTILGVYDGHGGKHCAEYIFKTLPQILSRNLTQNERISVAELITSSFVEVDSSITEGLRIFKPYLARILPRLVKQKVIDEKLRRGDIKELALRARSGSTALVAVIDEEYITLANVGDCRAVLGRIGILGNEVEVKTMTVDQNGHNEMERKRILSEHPNLEAHSLFAGGRLFGQLSVTRSFGDVFYKEPNTAYAEYVFGSAELTSRGRLPFNQHMAGFYPLIKTPPYLTAMPDITRHQRSSSDRFLIIASDGVWGLNGLTDEWAVRKVQEGIEKGGDPSKYMMEEVKKFRPGDDVTIMVIVFSAIQQKGAPDELVE